MNIVFWIIQVLLALHTLMGAVWKFSNPAQNMPSIAAIPAPAWLAMSVIEIVCALLLVVPGFMKGWGHLVPIAAGIVAAEMLLFIALHFGSAETNHSPVTYWGVVAVVCAFLAYGRHSIAPL